MKKLVLSLLAVALLALISSPASAEGWRRGERLSRQFQHVHSWHGQYYQKQWGAPMPLVVPPTVHTSTSWGWGVAQSEIRPIYHQFQRNYPGMLGGGGEGFYATPNWPSHTDQFGVYYVRGPW